MAAGSITRQPSPSTSRRSHCHVLLVCAHVPIGRCLPGAIALLCHVFWCSFSPGDGSLPPPEQGCRALFDLFSFRVHVLLFPTYQQWYGKINVVGGRWVGLLFFCFCLRPCNKNCGGYSACCSFLRFVCLYLISCCCLGNKRSAWNDEEGGPRIFYVHVFVYRPCRHDWWLNSCLLLRESTSNPPPLLEEASDHLSLDTAGGRRY